MFLLSRDWTRVLSEKLIATEAAFISCFGVLRRCVSFFHVHTLTTFIWNTDVKDVYFYVTRYNVTNSKTCRNCQANKTYKILLLKVARYTGETYHSYYAEL